MKDKAVSPFGRVDQSGTSVIVEIRAERSNVDEFETVATMRRHPSEMEIRLLDSSEVDVIRVGHERINQKGRV